MFKNKSFLAEKAIKSRLILSEGVDTYVQPGFRIRQLAMQTEARDQYLEQYSPLISLLRRDDKNPLVEEGDYRDSLHRMKQGELYLTYEAIALLVEKKIRTHKSSKKSLPYHSRNMYVIKNDLGNFEYILASLALALNDDAKVIYISGIHSVPIYLRNQQGRIRCLIVDSEADVNSYPHELMPVLYKVFPQLDLVMSSTKLQRDFYSCSTFAIKALMYFVKHGEDIFSWIDKVTTAEKNYGNYHSYQVLKPADLMPVLLKMGQTTLDLSPEVLATIVSTKQQLTLSDYFQRYTLNFDGDNDIAPGTFSKQNVNSAALVKKYRYVTLLNTYLQHLQKMTDETISSDACQALPKPIKKIVNNYAILHEQAQKKIAINPIDQYLDIVAFLDKTVPLLNLDSQSLFDAIKQKFPDYDSLYSSYLNNRWKISVKSLTRKLLFVAALSETNHWNYLDRYETFIIKLNELFADDSMIISYFKYHAIAHSKQPVHDLCLFVTPESRHWNRAYWGALVVKYGMAATRYLALAPQIDVLLSAHEAENHNHSLTELGWIRHLLEQFHYQNAAKNKKFAALCVAFNRPESQFEDSLALVNHGLKAFDFLPEITLHGRDIDERLARFTFTKLPVDDLRGLFLGEYTSCCQSLHRIGADCAIHGMTSAFGGFYVVYDNKKIIAQAWVWIGEEGEIVFDSWEYIHKNQAYLCQPLMLKAAEQFVNAGFSKVLLGKGGNTPNLPFASLERPVEFPRSKSYSDAHRQYLIKNSSYNTILARFKAYADYIHHPYLYLSLMKLRNYPAYDLMQA